MTNPGLSPINPSTLVGKLRLEIGDVHGEPLDPEVPGQLDYDWFSDSELAQFFGDESSVLRAAGRAVRQLALGGGLKAISIKTDDLSLDSQKRGSTLLEISQAYFADADAADSRTNGDLFQVIPFGGISTPAPGADLSWGAPPAQHSFRPDPFNPGYFVA